MLKVYLYGAVFCMVFFLLTAVMLIFYQDGPMHDYLIRAGLGSVAMAIILAFMLHFTAQKRIKDKRLMQRQTGGSGPVPPDGIGGTVIFITDLFGKGNTTDQRPN